jgi:hypothetical protein
VVIILDCKIKNEGTESYIVLSYQNLTEWAVPHELKAKGSMVRNIENSIKSVEVF